MTHIFIHDFLTFKVHFIYSKTKGIYYIKLKLPFSLSQVFENALEYIYIYIHTQIHIHINIHIHTENTSTKTLQRT